VIAHEIAVPFVYFALLCDSVLELIKGVNVVIKAIDHKPTALFPSLGNIFKRLTIQFI